MSDVKWIKLTVDMFSNYKINHIRKLPEGNNIILIWVMLLTLAGRCNAGGMIFLTQHIPYTTKSLADELGFDENVIILALKALSSYGMIQTDEHLMITNWNEYQNVEGLARIREQGRKRVASYRERQKELNECNVTVTLPVTQSNALERELDKDKEEELDLEKEGDEEIEDRNIVTQCSPKLRSIDCSTIVSLFNETCPSYPKVTALSDARRKAIKARLRSYTLDDFKTVFQIAEASPFLKGANDRNWSANFDWLIKDANFAKVLDGNYSHGNAQQKPKLSKAAQDLEDAYDMIAKWAAKGDD